MIGEIMKCWIVSINDPLMSRIYQGIFEITVTVQNTCF